MSDQHEGQWDNDVIYGKLLPHVKNMGYTDWVRLGDACAVMQQMRNDLQAQIAALSVPAPFAVDVQPPAHVLEQIMLEMDGEYGLDTLRYVVYNDAERGEWLQQSPAPAPAVPDEIAETMRCALDETAEDIGMNPAFYADPYEAMRKVEAALSWLAQQRAVPSSGTA